MRTIRLIWPAEISPEAVGEVFLADDQARHGTMVLRLDPGAAVEMVGSAGLAPARVTAVEPGGKKRPPRLSVTLTGPWKRSALECGPRLALALIQGQRFDWAVEKAVELGAAALIPFLAERSKAGEASPGQAKRDRWKRLAEEARKQCGRSAPMEICPPAGLAELLAMPGPGFFLSPVEGEPVGLFQAESPLLVIGPEGGFSPREELALKDAGFVPWKLGGSVLRTETAALAALAAFMVHRF